MDIPIEDYLEKGDLSKITTYQAGALQAAVHRILQKHSDELLKDYGISKMQWLIIGLVLDAGDKGTRITDLASQLGTTLAYLTTAVNILERKQMLTRTTNTVDSRSKIVAIDPHFKPKCAAIEQTLRDGLRASVYKNISPAEFRVYMKVLYQLGKIS